MHLTPVVRLLEMQAYGRIALAIERPATIDRSRK